MRSTRRGLSHPFTAYSVTSHCFKRTDTLPFKWVLWRWKNPFHTDFILGQLLEVARFCVEWRKKREKKISQKPSKKRFYFETLCFKQSTFFFCLHPRVKKIILVKYKLFWLYCIYNDNNYYNLKYEHILSLISSDS